MKHICPDCSWYRGRLRYCRPEAESNLQFHAIHGNYYKALWPETRNHHGDCKYFKQKPLKPPKVSWINRIKNYFERISK